MRRRVLGMVLAGGKGTRLYPLTRDRAKPAVPFGGKYRIIDWVLSNFMNSGIYSIYVLTQFKSQSLTEHLQRGWGFVSMLKDHFVIPVPAQMRTGEFWYRGTADAIMQNLNLIRESRPHLIAIFGGDHIYRMDISQMVSFHNDKDADVTIAGISVPIAEASAFGIMRVGEDGRILEFEEKPEKPSPMPDDPTRSLASMGNYVFSYRALVDALEADAADENSSHDFGKDVLPRLLAQGSNLYCYPFEKNKIPGQEGANTYWRDVGTIEAFYEATLDLRDVVPRFNLYNRQWPIGTQMRDLPPAKFVHDEEGRRGQAIQSMVAEGTIISGATVRGSVVGRNVRVNSYSELDDCIVFDNAEIGRNVKLRGVIIDKNVKVPDGEVIGFDRAQDERRFFVSGSGLVVIPKQPFFEGRVGAVEI
ncbi:MAG: glucose-1-phosphate adenylyltransferase [Planctomycetes bacterium]|nr:glucose-1-phosphate adenylyltransferase [Planctomycetota bacterium]